MIINFDFNCITPKQNAHLFLLFILLKSDYQYNLLQFILLLCNCNCYNSNKN